MFDALKFRLARRRALKRVRTRTVRPWSPSPVARHLLVVMRAGEGAAQEAWRFVKSLGLPPKQITPVVLSGEVTYVPAEYVRFLRRLEGEEVSKLGLPKAEFAEQVWGEHPDLAFCLVPEFDLAAAYLVGASPAQLRVGLYSEAAEPFFDLMIAPGASVASAFASLRDTLRRMNPPALDLGPPGDEAT
jgi:hypothetical protein